jgi:hypothetical protein
VTILELEESHSAHLPEPDAVVRHSTSTPDAVVCHSTPTENQPVQIRTDGKEWTLEEILAREG